MKKIFFALGILIVGMVVMAYLYFSNLKKGTGVNDLSLNEVTSQSALVFSYDSETAFYDILGGQEIFGNVLGAKKLAVLQSLLQFSQKKALTKLILSQRVYVGFVPTEKDSVDFMLVTQLNKNLDLIKTLNATQSDSISLKSRGSFYELTFADQSTCFLSVKDRLLTISNAQNIFNKKLASDDSQPFAAYVKNNGRFNKNTLANLYIDFNRLPLLLKNILNTNLNGELSVFDKQNSYATLSYNFSKDKLLFNGYTTLNNSSDYLHLFIDEREQKLNIDKILPNNTANYTFYAIGNYVSWKKKFDVYLRTNNNYEKVSENIAAINQKYRIDLDQLLPKYFKNQLITFQLSTGEKFGAIELKNGDKVSQLLMDVSANYAENINIFKDEKILYDYFGDIFKKFDRPFYTVIDNYLIFANNASSIQSFLRSYKANDLLVNTDRYAKFGDQLSASSTVCFYVNNANSDDLFGRNLKLPYWKQYKSTGGFKNFNAFCYQLSADNGSFLTNLLLLKNMDEELVDTAGLKIPSSN